jgi:hypothetical protein
MTRKRTTLLAHGDEMSELNIQRRLQWLRECNPRGIVYVSDEDIKEDPALQIAVQELDWLQPESRRVRQ